jgi:hypothetical protein
MLYESLLYCDPAVARRHGCECAWVQPCVVEPMQFEGNRDGKVGER